MWHRNGLDQSGATRTGADVIISFCDSKELSHFSSHFSIPKPFLLRVVSGDAILENSQMYLRKNWSNPMKLRSSVKDFGVGHLRITSTLSGLTLIPLRPTTRPRNLVSSCTKLHFSEDAYSFSSCSLESTISKCLRCSSSFLLKIRGHQCIPLKMHHCNRGISDS